MADEYIQGVVSLLHCNGADGSQSFKDSATTTYWAVTGDVAISTTQSKFGGASFYKEAGNHYLGTPSRPELNMEGYDFTVELWVYPIAFAQYNFPIAKVSSANHNGFRIGYESNGALYVHCSGSGNAAATPVWTIVADQWQHLALTRAGGVARVFVNGVVKGTWTDNTVITNDVPVYLGQDGNGWNGYAGYIDEVRITKGQCRYSSDFTPPDAPFDNPPQWWDAAPSLTPVAAWDASRVDGAMLLDGVGENNITASQTLRVNEYKNIGVSGNGEKMLFTTGIPIPATGVVAGWWSPLSSTFILGNAPFQPYGTVYRPTGLMSPTHGISNAWSSGWFGQYGDSSTPVFAAMVTRGTDVIYYVNGEQLGGAVDISYANWTVTMIGDHYGYDENLADNEYLHALGFWTGEATQDDIKAIEAAARLALKGVGATNRGFTPLVGRTDSNLPQLTLPNPAPPRYAGSTLALRDCQFGGKGRIAGTVKEKGTPDMPLKRKVQLFDEISKLLVAELWSDPVTGAYLFENIDPNLTYSIISYDYTGMYRAVIANGQKATT